MTPIEDRLLEIADDHDRRASRLSDRENVASERQASLAIRAALLSIGVLRAERDSLRSQLDAARGALRPLADIPLEELDKQDKPDQPLMSWNDHKIYVRDVLAARAALRESQGEGT